MQHFIKTDHAVLSWKTWARKLGTRLRAFSGNLQIKLLLNCDVNFVHSQEATTLTPNPIFGW